MAELAQALRRQQQVVVVQPHGRLGRDQLARRRRERAVDLRGSSPSSPSTKATCCGNEWKSGHSAPLQKPL